MSAGKRLNLLVLLAAILLAGCANTAPSTTGKAAEPNCFTDLSLCKLQR